MDLICNGLAERSVAPRSEKPLLEKSIAPGDLAGVYVSVIPAELDWYCENASYMSCDVARLAADRSETRSTTLVSGIKVNA